jgi:hypothetical protein
MQFSPQQDAAMVKVAMSSGCSIRRARIIIGESGSWRGISRFVVYLGLAAGFCGVPTFDRIKSSGLGREAGKVKTARRRRLGARS